MTKSKPTAVDPEIPDGPEPHVPPIWSYLCLERPNALEAVEDMTRGLKGQAPATGASVADWNTAAWTLAMAPYQFMWNAFAASLDAFAASGAQKPRPKD